MRPRKDPKPTLRHDATGLQVPPIAMISDHKSMYRQRAKLRDILHTVDRHNTGAMPRHKFHLCLELAGLPVPDRNNEQTMYGKFLERDVFRYGDFLECQKYDPAYRHLLTSRWRQAGGGRQPTKMRAPGGSSFTPEPGAMGLQPPQGITLPQIGKPVSRAQGRLSRMGGSRGALGGSRGGANVGGVKRLRDAFRSLDANNTGTVTIEELQQGLVALDLVPAASNNELLQLFQSCDRDGQGNIDYNELVQKLQMREAQGNPMFVPGYRGPGTAFSHKGGSRVGSRATPGTLLSAVDSRLHMKHKMLKDALSAADPQQTGKVALATLKDVLQSLNIVSKQQLASGDLDDFLGQYTNGGTVRYNEFADSVKAQDMAQLTALRK